MDRMSSVVLREGMGLAERRVSSLPNFSGLDDAGPLPFPLHTVGTRYRPTGEQRLLLAVLCDALHLYASARARRHSRRLNELREWFTSDDRSYVFSFHSVCEALGLDGAGIRRRV